MKKLLIILLLIGVAGLAAMKLMAEKKRVAEEPTALTLNYTIQTIMPAEREVYEKRSFLASVTSDKEIKVMTKLSGVITTLHVSESDRVKKGDLLVEIDDSSIMSTLNTLYKTAQVQQSDVAYYTTVQNTNERLFKANAISKERYDASHLQLLSKIAALDATKEKIKAIKSDLTYLKVRAPFDGIISSIYMHKGDLATAQKPILALSANKQKMTFSFADTQKSIAIGDTIIANKRAIGHISKIYPNAQNNLSIAEVKLDRVLQIRNDAYLSIEVIINSMRGCSVPLNTLLHTKEATYLLVYKDHKFTKHKVDILLEDDLHAIIAPCISDPIALASESKLSILPFYKNITIVGASNEK